MARKETDNKNGLTKAESRRARQAGKAMARNRDLTETEQKIVTEAVKLFKKSGDLDRAVESLIDPPFPPGDINLIKETVLHVANIFQGDSNQAVYRFGQPQADREAVRVFKMLDMLLEPIESEEVLGDLSEQYGKRLKADPSHAKWWLRFQVLWVLKNRVLKLMRQVVQARAGK